MLQNQPLPIDQRTVDLSNCAKEPIHIPGKIQSHGFLIGLNKNSRVIKFTSDNLKKFIGIDASEILERDIRDFILLSGLTSGHSDLPDLIQYALNVEVEEINPIAVTCNGQQFNLIVNLAGDYVLLEFETAFPDIDKELQRLIGVSLSRILEAKTLEQVLQFAAKQVKEIIHYDRVMVYKFWEDGHGEVVGEEKNDNLEPFMGLHYPASDIPQQARELYKQNLVRIIADVDSTPADIVTSDAGLTATSLNLTNSTLRAVSPIHIEYLKNMGVKSSFSISIVIKDRLWGLIACHNYTAKFIDYKARNSGKLIGKILSSALEYREEVERKERARKFQGILQEILKTMIKNWNIAEGLVYQKANFLSLTDATGAALLFENNIYTLGETPDKNQIRELYNWIKKQNRESVYHTNNLSQKFPPAEEYQNIASGVLGCSLSWEMDEFIMWFKPEIRKTVKWAGDPNKPVEIDDRGNQKISPRRSFAVWSENVQGNSEPWTAAEIGSAMKLREEIIHVLNDKANQIRRLNDELKKAYEELDTFSYTISHDLKTPLASIKNYTEILLEDHNDMAEDAKKILDKVIRNTDRMNLLIREVLSYSRIGKQEMHLKELDMRSIIENAKNEILAAYNENERAQIIIGNTPAIDGDEIMISQVFTNLIGNGVKYSLKKNDPVVKIDGKTSEESVLYTIQDNGIGIDMTMGNQIFELFRRMENARAYEGTGVGLSIVKRILEKHKARIWYESEPDNGTIFYLLFKK